MPGTRRGQQTQIRKAVDVLTSVTLEDVPGMRDREANLVTQFRVPCPFTTHTHPEFLFQP